MNSENTWAPIFGADTRAAKKSNSASLRNVGAPATGYGLHPGDKLTFEKGATIDTIEVWDQDPIRAVDQHATIRIMKIAVSDD